MAEQSKNADLLHAFSLGCLDQEELFELKEYFDSGEEYEWQELGEYQNLVALLPSILNMEVPGPQIKDKVARKLYRYRAEKKIKKETGENVFSKTEDMEILGRQGEPIISGIDINHSAENKYSSDETENQSAHISDFEVVSSTQQEKHFSRPSHETQILGRSGEVAHLEEDEKTILAGKKEEPLSAAQKSLSGSSYEKRSSSNKKTGKNFDEETKKSSRGWLIFSTFLFLFVAAGMVILYYKVSSEVKGYKSGVENLNDQIRNLSLELSENQELQNVLQTKNVRIINLNGTKLSSSGFGKLIMSLENSKGFLQLSQLPVLPANKAYQLWINIKGKYNSLGVFTPSKDVDYFKFSLPELSNQAETNFILTEEPASGSIMPGKEIYFTGSLK